MNTIKTKGAPIAMTTTVPRTDTVYKMVNSSTLLTATTEIFQLTVRKKPPRAIIKTSSITKMSLENKLRIRPVGVSSKNDKGLLIKAPNDLSWRLLLDLRAQTILRVVTLTTLAMEPEIPTRP